MPLTPTVTSVLQNEWERFIQGFRDLGPERRAELRYRTISDLQRTGGAATITIPGWDDVVHITPRTALDPSKVTDHYRATRAGEPSPLDAAELAEFERRKTRRDAARSTIQPGYAQAFGQIMTAIDNVQDMTTAAVVVGRLALWPTIHGLNALGPVLGPSLGGAATVSAWGLGRFVPILGWVLLAGDLLKLLNFLGLLAMPLYAAVCRAPAEILAAGVPAGVFGRLLKVKAEGMAALNPMSRHARLHRAMALRRAVPTVGNLVEVAQVTDQFFGVGISFGGLVGAMMEGAYALTRHSIGENVSTAWGAASQSASRLLSGRLGGYTPAELEAKQRAGQMLKYLPIHTNTQETFTENEHVAALGAAIFAVDLIAPDVALLDLESLADVIGAAPITPTPPDDPWTLALLDELPDGAASAERWPAPGAPRDLEAQAYAELAAASTGPALHAFLEPRRDGLVGAFYGALVNTLMERLWLMLEGDDRAVSYELLPVYQVVAGLCAANRLVNVSDDPEAIGRFFADAEARVVSTRRAFWPASEYDALAAVHGLQLIKLVAPSE